MIDVWRLVPSRKFVIDASQCLDMARLSLAFVETDEMALKLLGAIGWNCRTARGRIDVKLLLETKS
ncbi:hypothetical protein FHT29_006443 [Rhizobium sp. SG741]|nr:hypothetical protein [Rhizobium sp. SG741]